MYSLFLHVLVIFLVVVGNYNLFFHFALVNFCLYGSTKLLHVLFSSDLFHFLLKLEILINIIFPCLLKNNVSCCNVQSRVNVFISHYLKICWDGKWQWHPKLYIWHHNIMREKNLAKFHHSNPTHFKVRNKIFHLWIVELETIVESCLL